MDTPNEPTAARPEPYRLGIDDLFVYMALAAFALGWRLREFQISNTEANWSGAEEGRFRLMFGYQSLFVGCQLASLYLLAKSRRRRLSFPAAPGHFILVLAGVDFLTRVVQSEVARVLNPLGEPMDRTSVLVRFFESGWMGLSIACVLAGLVASRTPSWRWRLYFGIQSAFFLSLLATSLFFSVALWSGMRPLHPAMSILFACSYGLFYAWACWTALCLGWDRYAGRRWDMLHYLGVLSIWAFFLGNEVFNRWFK